MSSRDTMTTLSSLSSFYHPRASPVIQSHSVGPLHVFPALQGNRDQPFVFDYTFQQAAQPSSVSSSASPTDEENDLGSAALHKIRDKPKQGINSFFAYKMWMSKQHGGRPELQGYNQQTLCKLWGVLWNELKEDEQTYWKYEAKRLTSERRSYGGHSSSFEIRTATKRESGKRGDQAKVLDDEGIKKLAKDVFGVEVKNISSLTKRKRARRGGASTLHTLLPSLSASTSGGSSGSALGGGDGMPWSSHLGYQFDPVTCQPGNWQSLGQNQPQNNLNNLYTSHGANVAPDSYPHPGQNVSVEVGDFSMPNFDFHNWDFGTNHGLASETFGHGMAPFPPLDFQGLQAVDGSGPWGSTMF